MTDPLAEVVGMLKPEPSISKLVTGGGRWIVRREEVGRAFYAAVLEGACLLTVSGRAPLKLLAGDFVLVPAIFNFTATSLDPPPPGALTSRTQTGPGVVRLGDPQAPTEVRMLVGHCAFAGCNRGLLVSLLPDVIHVRGQDRLTTLVRMIDDETRAERTARGLVLSRLLEVLMIEALRSITGAAAHPGLLRGLTDERLAAALRRIHAEPAHGWTVADLARESALSRSAFFGRFRREVGVAPMEYLLGWRMALAKDLLLSGTGPLAEVARQVGYGSASAFSMAFARHVGIAPGAFARATGRDLATAL